MAELVAHDLRNYFANIIFAADMVGGAEGLQPAHRRMAESIRSSADSGMLFLQAFLEQQEHVAHGAEIEPLPVRQLLHEVVDLLSRKAAAKEISLELLEHETIMFSGCGPAPRTCCRTWFPTRSSIRRAVRASPSAPRRPRGVDACW